VHVKAYYRFLASAGVSISLVAGGASFAVQQSDVAQTVDEDDAAAAAGPRRFLLNARLEPDGTTGFFTMPEGARLVVTDIVMQNRSLGDEPVSELAFSRVSFGPFEQDFVAKQREVTFNAVGDKSVNVHFDKGMMAARIPTQFKISNATKSTAVYCDIVITGYLRRGYAKD
jgi:hypothetical protein